MMRDMERDVVGSILASKPNEPVGILFRNHAAIYFLDRNHPRFDEWLDLLEASRRDGRPVGFTFVDEGQRLTSVAQID